MTDNSNLTPVARAEKALTESEAKIQADAFKWFHNTYPHLRKLLHHIPNGEDRDIRTAVKLKAMGVVAGAPDMNFYFRQRTYFFEFKKPKTGKASENQLKFHAQLERQGFEIWIIDTVDQFKEAIEKITTDKNELTMLGVPKEQYYYKHKIFEYIYSLGNGDLIVIDEVCEKATQKAFVQCVSDFIIEGYDNQDNFEILFTHDFRAFYKKIFNTDVEVTYNGKNYV